MSFAEWILFNLMRVNSLTIFVSLQARLLQGYRCRFRDSRLARRDAHGMPLATG
jgi:hypothetical protein